MKARCHKNGCAREVLPYRWDRSWLSAEAEPGAERTGPTFGFGGYGLILGGMAVLELSIGGA